MIRFPDPRHTDENGILYVGGKLTEENLLNAYGKGIFPWPHGDLPLLWFCPPERGVIFFEQFRVPKSTRKQLRKKNFRISFDQDFPAVMAGCAQQERPGQGGTWITDEMIKAYVDLSRQGFARSVECWQGEELVGGLYGIFYKNVFSAESMFFKESGASKAALIAMVEKLRSEGLLWMDIQMITEVTESFGGEWLDREDFLALLKRSQK